MLSPSDSLRGAGGLGREGFWLLSIPTFAKRLKTHERRDGSTWGPRVTRFRLLTDLPLAGWSVGGEFLHFPPVLAPCHQCLAKRVGPPCGERIVMPCFCSLLCIFLSTLIFSTLFHKDLLSTNYMQGTVIVTGDIGGTRSLYC